MPRRDRPCTVGSFWRARIPLGVYSLAKVWFDFSVTSRATIVARTTPFILPLSLIVRTTIMIAKFEWRRRSHRNHVDGLSDLNNYRLSFHAVHAVSRTQADKSNMTFRSRAFS